MNKPLLAGLAIFLLFAGVAIVLATRHFLTRSAGVGGSTGPIVYYHGNWEKQKWVKEFTLAERSGKNFHSKEMKGKVWVASFFFTSCASFCYKQNLEVKDLHEEFGPRGVTFVSISTDPQRDTPAKLRKYAASFSADPKKWLFLTGEPLHIRRIAAERFQTAVDTDDGTHSSNLIAIDRWGNIRGMFNSLKPEKVAELKTLLGKLLIEETPPPLEKPSIRPPPEEDEEDAEENEQPAKDQKVLQTP